MHCPAAFLLPLAFPLLLTPPLSASASASSSQEFATFPEGQPAVLPTEQGLCSREEEGDGRDAPPLASGFVVAPSGTGRSAMWDTQKAALTLFSTFLMPHRGPGDVGGVPRRPVPRWVGTGGSGLRPVLGRPEPDWRPGLLHVLLVRAQRPRGVTRLGACVGLSAHGRATERAARRQASARSSPRHSQSETADIRL